MDNNASRINSLNTNRMNRPDGMADRPGKNRCIGNQ